MGKEANEVERTDHRDTQRPHRLFGEALVRARENLHLERPEVAAQAAISYPMLANIESGRRRASDDIIERLAPVLGIPTDRMRDARDAADRMRHVRNAMFHGRAPFDLSLYLTAEHHARPEASEVTDEGADAVANEVERLLTDVLVEQQRAETFALAARPKMDAPFASMRMQLTSDIIRDLGLLDDTDLAKVRGYVDGLRASRDRVATAVTPATDTPLIRIADEPFGPLTPWPAPEWLKNVRQVDLSRRVREYREIARRGQFTKFSREAGAVLAAGPNDDDRPLPCENHNEAGEAARVGERLARDFAKRAGGDAGMITAADWRSLESLRVYRLDDARKSASLNWVVRMAVFATLLWPDDTEARIDFVKRCIPIYKDQAALIGLERP